MVFRQALRPLRSKEVKQLQSFCTQYYGVSFSTDCAFFIHEKHMDVYLISRAIDDVPYDRLTVNNVGLYIGQWMHEVFRLSIEGAQILRPTAHVLEVNDAKAYLFGDDVSGLSVEDGWYAVRCGHDWLGCGLVKQGVLKNHTPKGRRISSKE